jgi:HK97 gp10 family phage protein
MWFEGIDELNTITYELERANGQIGAKGAAVIRRSAHQVEAVAKLFCPVDTGHLKGTIGVDVDGDGRFGAMSAEIGPTAHYGGYVEFGTRNMAPHAYMGPALDRVTPSFVAACEAITDPFDGGGLRGRSGGGRG